MSEVAQTTALAKEIETRIRKSVGELKMLPATAMQALDVAKRPDCSIGEFSAVIERDVKLTADILSMANSVMYSSGIPIVSLHQSVSRLGFRQCKNLILTSSMTALMKKMSFEEESIREHLWKHGFVAAMLGLHLNRILGAGFQGEEFTAGLIHDFGRTLFAVSLPEMFREIDPMSFDESSATLEHERSIVGTDHCEIGGWFAVENRLPEPLVEVVMHHHQPEKAQQHQKLVALAAAADHMANHLHRNEGPLGYDPQVNTAIPLLEKIGVKDATAKFAKSYSAIMESGARDAEELMEE